jgi:hypothetical protein
VLDSRVLSGIGSEGARQIRLRSPRRDGGAFGPEVSGPWCPEKPLGVERWVLVPQTDTGRRVEDTQANGRTFVKEFGKLAP